MPNRIAKIKIDTPSLRGEVNARCVTGEICCLIIGNGPGARSADDSDLGWVGSVAVNLRAQIKPKEVDWFTALGLLRHNLRCIQILEEEFKGAVVNLRRTSKKIVFIRAPGLGRSLAIPRRTFKMSSRWNDGKIEKFCKK